MVINHPAGWGEGAANLRPCLIGTNFYGGSHVMQPTRRNPPLVLVLADPSSTARATQFWRDQGAVVVQARDDGGCLRVATAVGPDIIVLDNTASRRLLKLLAAHPVSARAQIERLPEHATPRVARAA